MKRTYALLLIIGFTYTFTSCNSSVDLCVNFDKTAYSVGDTIQATAACSKNVDNYNWSTGEALDMIGDGTNATENFVILPLTGASYRTVTISISNSKSSKSSTESVLVL
jgi:hypothetical protein